MNDNINDLVDKFNTIKKNKWHENTGKGRGGLGITFEKLLGLQSNSWQLPDYNAIEIKTINNYRNDKITLFHLTPDSEILIIKNICDKFGLKSNTRIFSLKISSTKKSIPYVGKKEYSYKLFLCDTTKRLFVHVYKNNILYDNTIWWSYDYLKQRLKLKLSWLAIIEGEQRKYANITQYKYNNIDIYKLTNFDSFLECIRKSYIYISFNVGVYTKGDNIGKIWDHGVSFTLYYKKINKLFTLHERPILH